MRQECSVHCCTLRANAVPGMWETFSKLSNKLIACEENLEEHYLQNIIYFLLQTWHLRPYEVK